MVAFADCLGIRLEMEPNERVLLMDPRVECLDDAMITPLRLSRDYYYNQSLGKAVG